MGLFGDLDVASVSEDILKIADGTYPAILTKISTSKSQSKTDNRGNPQVGVTLTYTINDDENDYNGRKVTQYQTVPQPPKGEQMDADELKNAAYLKRLLGSLGVPEERMNEVEISDLQGTEVFITIRTNGEYTNVTSVKTQEEVNASDVQF